MCAVLTISILIKDRKDGKDRKDET